MKYLYLTTLFLFYFNLSYSQSACSDPRCIFYKYSITPSGDLLKYQNENMSPMFFINEPRSNYSQAAFLKIAIINEHYGKQDFVKIFVEKDGYWSQIGTIHLCGLNHNDRHIYFLNGYNYAYSKGDNKPKKIKLIDQNKRWKAE